jgi:hypothetical protein
MWFIITYVYHLALCARRVFFMPHYIRLLTELVAVYSKLSQLKDSNVA